jgi:putative colanic acid biosynthesis acetyltransferase WcaF
MIAWALLGSWTPSPFYNWRAFLLKCFGAKMARGSSVHGSAKVWNPSLLELEEFSSIGPGVICYSMARISIGSYAIVSQRAHLCAGTHDIEDPNFQLRARPIEIESRAWIAAEAFVGPGVKVGEGAVLGARAVTFEDLDAWTVYVGNPAKATKLRKIRFSDADSKTRA